MRGDQTTVWLQSYISILQLSFVCLWSFVFAPLDEINSTPQKWRSQWRRSSSRSCLPSQGWYLQHGPDHAPAGRSRCIVRRYVRRRRLKTLKSAALPSNPLAHASRALDIHPSFRAFRPPAPIHGRVSTPPRPRRERDQPFPACAPDQPCTRTAHTRPAHTRSTWPPARQHPRRCHPRPHPARTAATPSFAHGCVACARARSHLHLPVAGCGTPSSTTAPSRPSKRPPAAASS